MGWPYQQKPLMGWPLDFNSGLVPEAGFWPMLEGAGNIIQDLSGNGNDGVLIGNAHFVPGEFNSVLDFGGAGDYVNTGLSIAGMTNFSVVMSILMRDQSAFRTLWSADSAGGGCTGEGVFCHDATQMRFRVATVQQTITVPTIENVWTHIAMTYSPSQRLIYFDGVVVYDQVGGGAANGDTNFQIAAYNQCTAATDFDGQIDYTFVYNRTLSASEISLLLREPFGMFKDPNEMLLEYAWGAAAGTILPQITSAYMRI